MSPLQFADILEKCECPQIADSYIDGDSCCALGTMLKASDSSAQALSDLPSEVIQELTDLDKELLMLGIDVMRLNHKKTFKEIAAIIQEEVNA